MSRLKLEVVTPNMVLVDTQADYVTIPGKIGEMGILPGHLPILTSLHTGVLTYKTGGEEHKIAVHYGFAQVHQDKITVVAKLAEHGNEIDLERIQRLIDRTRESLGKLSDDDLDKKQRLLEGKLARALTRQHAGSRFS